MQHSFLTSSEIAEKGTPGKQTTPLTSISSLQPCLVVVAVASGCKQLKSLDLRCCSKITDAAAVVVAAKCKQLTSLNLGCCGEITDAAVAAVASKCKVLSTLYLYGCSNITDAAKANIPETIRVKC